MPMSRGIIAESIITNLPLLPAYYLISTNVLSATSVSTFSSIPSTYNALQLRVNLLPSSGVPFYIQINGVSSGYTYHYMINASYLVTSGTSAGAYSGWYNNPWSGVTLSGIFDFLDYANPNKNKIFKGVASSNNGAATGVYGFLELDSYNFASTSAISSISFNTFSGTMTGSMSLYGIL